MMSMIFYSGLEQLFYMYCHPDSGLLTKEGFISVLRGLHLDPTNTFIESIYTEHNKDGNGMYLNYLGNVI